MKKVLLKINNLCKSFANNGEQNHVLSNINAEIYAGDFTVIMGSSGSGKSTFLHCISGMDTITSGEIIYDNKVISNCSERELATLRSGDFGFVFQQMHLVSNLTLFENVVVPGYLKKGVSANDVNKRSNLLFDTFNISNIKSHLPSQASGGEKQRAAIARALISNPVILFADEPTGALNRKSGNEVLSLFREINEEGQSILMVTHDVRAAICANRILYLEDGKIIGELTLPPYKDSDYKNRETQITSWLSSMSW